MRCLSKRTREFGTRSLDRPSVVLISRIILFFQLLASRKRRFAVRRTIGVIRHRKIAGRRYLLSYRAKRESTTPPTTGTSSFSGVAWHREAGRSRARRGEERCDRAKALGSNSLKCPVVRKKPLRVKNSLPWCVGARSLDTVCVSTPAVVWSIAFRSLFFLLGIILVFMASIKCTVDSSTFRDSTLLARAPLSNRPPLLAECLNLTSHPHL